ncbi:MAG: sigma-70 family RNA polymerase sigma factor, partial [Clostridia bacterium]|nr:sigma-70 family RNA polymerase sigma factor [Clostridia bacterium]
NFKNECSINVWLCQIAKNKWKDYISKSKKLKLVPFDDTLGITSLDNNIEYSIDSKNEIIQLYKKIHELDEKTREVFYLRIKGELSFKEIGEILNKTEEWARITFYRGKIKLKEALNNEQKRM